MKALVKTKKKAMKDSSPAERVSKEVAQTVLDNISEGILLLSKDFKILWANKKIMEMMDSRKDKIIGNFCYKVTHHRDEPCCGPHDICPIGEVLKKETPIRVIHTHFDRKGREIYVEVSAYPVKDKKGKPSQFIHIARNVSERVKARMALEEAKEFTEDIIKSMIDTLIVVDQKGRIKTVNQATEELLGYKKDELIGKPVDILLTGGEKDFIFKCEEKKVNFKEGYVCNYDMNYRAKNGDIIPVSFSGALMKNKEGKTVGVVGIARDMRQIKRLEKRLARSEKLAAIGELAAGVAHEINNPLNVISGHAEMLAMEKKDEEVKKATRVIMQQVKRAATITQRLLQFSKKVEPKIEEIDINKLLEDTIPFLDYEIKNRNITIIRDLNPDLPHLMADLSQLQEVFLNIMLNSAQAMPNGGALTLRTYTEKITEFGRRKTDKFKLGDKIVVIELEDTGEGIPEENLGKLFDPFFSTKEGGTGLGLSICHGIIESHGGTIDVRSQLGNGTSVIIQLPVLKEKEMPDG